MFVLQEALPRWHEIVSLAFSADGRWLASASDGPKDGRVMLWDVPARCLKGSVIHRRVGFHLVGLSPDGAKLAAGSRDKCLRVWDLAEVLTGLNSSPPASEARERTRRKGKIVLSSLAFSPDGKTLFVGRGDASRMSPHRGGELAWLAEDLERSLALDEPICSLGCSPDGGMLALGTVHRGTLLCETQSGREVAALKQSHLVRALAFSSDGRTLATAAGWSAKLWDVEARQERALLEGHRQMVWTLAFSPDGRVLATGAGDGTVRLWDSIGGKELAAYDWGTGSVRALAFAPDGMTLAAGGGGAHSLVIQDVDVVEGPSRLSVCSGESRRLEFRCGRKWPLPEPWRARVPFD
jgi:WD40 repeat protein